MNGGALIGGRYQLLRGIGAGGMGEVWEALHTVTRKRVAIKVLNGKYARQPSVRARFLLEARAACRVRHPNVVQVHDVMELADGAPAMVMDLLEGESLSAKLERETAISIGPLATILAPVVDAMMAAHGLGIVHRDLKPDNLFLERLADGGTVVKVLDFGIAKVTETDEERGSPALTGTGAVLGTPYYMSPEQAFGEKDLDHRSDVWSLGVILYECLAGVRPTEGDNFGQILKMITTGAIPSLTILAPQTPTDVANLVMRMLACDRAKRPALAEVLDVLRRYARGTSSVRVVAITPITPLSSEAPCAFDSAAAQGELDQTAPAYETTGPGRLPKGRMRALGWSAAAAAFVVLASVGALGALGARSRLDASRSPHVEKAAGLMAAAPPIVAELPPPAAPVEPLTVAAPLPSLAAPIAPAVPIAVAPRVTEPKAKAAQAPAPTAASVATASTTPKPNATTNVGKLYGENPF